MKIASCVKIVPTENAVTKFPDGGIKADYINSVEASPYDYNAVEAAMQLAKSVGGAEVIAITAADEATVSSKIKKNILSRGPGRLACVTCGDTARVDTLSAAKALQFGVMQEGDVDLVVCGEGSGDMYNQLTGNMLGALLGWPVLNGVNSMTMDGESLMVTRVNGHEVETYRVTLPAVISVTSDINVPKIPSIKDIMGANKKPSAITAYAADTTGAYAQTGLRAPIARARMKKTAAADVDGALSEFAEQLKRLK